MAITSQELERLNGKMDKLIATLEKIVALLSKEKLNER